MPHTPKTMSATPKFFKSAEDKTTKPAVHEKETNPRKEKIVHEEETDTSGSEDETTTSGSVIRQNFRREIEAALNVQINRELQACYIYKSMWAYFDRADVALHGFSKFFMDNAKEENKHAVEMMQYMNKRGGCVVFEDIPKPTVVKWETPLIAMVTALEMEKDLNVILLDLHKLSLKRCDPHAEDFIKKYLIEQVKMIKKLSDHVTNLKRVGDGEGVYLFDKKTLGGEVICKHKHDSDSSDSSDSDSD